MALTKITSRILDSSGVTILGTIATGVWQGTAINQTYLVGQSGTNTGDQTNIPGNAGTATLADEATILANTRNINGVAFNGSTNITIADATKLALAGGTLTGALVGTSATFNTGASRGIVLDNDSVDTPYNVISLNGTNVKGSYSGIAGGGTGNDNLYLNSADGVIVQTGSSFTPKLTILTGGNVGIGTGSTAPQHKLNVQVGTDSRLGVFGNGTYVGIGAVVDNNSAYRAMKLYATDYEFRIGNTPKLTISSYGEATFGSTTDYKIGLNDSAGTNQWWLKSYTNGSFAFHENGVGDKFNILAGGNVGIGTTSPKTKLDIYHNADIWHAFIGGATSKLLIGGQAGSGGVVLQAGNASTANNAAPTTFYPMLLQRDGGNVGIGTNSPGHLLDVDGTIRGNRLRILPNGVNNSYIFVDATNTFAGALSIQAGEGSSGYGGSFVAYGHSHASRAGFVSAGISAGSGGKFTVMSGANGSGADVFSVDSSGSVTAASLTTSGTNVFTGSTPLTFHKTGSDTYTKTVVYDAQNNTTDNAFSGITIEMAKLTNSNSAAMRNFTISSRGATEKYSFSRHGLSFNQVTASAINSLNAYEEGTWVVTLPNSAGATISTYRARYTVVGNVCHFQLYVIMSSIPSNTDQFHISLPITPDSTTADYTGVSMGYCNTFNTNSWLPITHATLAFIYFHKNTGGASGGAVITNAEASGLPQIILSGHYYI